MRRIAARGPAKGDAGRGRTERAGAACYLTAPTLIGATTLTEGNARRTV